MHSDKRLKGASSSGSIFKGLWQHLQGTHRQLVKQMQAIAEVVMTLQVTALGKKGSLGDAIITKLRSYLGDQNYPL